MIIRLKASPLDRDHPTTASGRRRVSIDPGTVVALTAHWQRQQKRAAVLCRRLVRDHHVFSPEMDGARL
ncbi:MAG: hypothetical protein ACRD0D_12220 [Acidimicrobiales bacterium]